MTVISQTKIRLVTGADEYSVDRKAREIVDALVPADNRALGLETIDGGAEKAEQAAEALKRCASAVMSYGLLGGDKVVWLRGVNFLGGLLGRTVVVKESLQSFAQLLSGGIPEGHTLVISAIGADASSPLRKACKGGEVTDLGGAANEKDAGKAAAAFLAEELARRKIRMGREASEEFIGRVGGDCRLIASDLEKISIYIGDRKEITAEDVRLMASPMNELRAWDLADAFGRRDLAGSLRIARQLFFQKESLVGLLGGLERRTRELLLMKRLLDSGAARIAKDGWKSVVAWDLTPEAEEALAALSRENPRSLNPYRAFLLAQQASLFRLPELVRIRDAIAAAHADAVSSSSMPEHIAMELLLIRTLGLVVSIEGHWHGPCG